MRTNRFLPLFIALALILFLLAAPTKRNNPQTVLPHKEVIGLQAPTLTPSLVTVPIDHINDRQAAQVVKVVDGDTITVLLDGKQETIRIIGIDTPESVDPRRPVQCYAIQSSDRTRSLLSQQTVYLVRDPSQGERDKYGRLLRYIFLVPDQSDFGKQMIADGFAFEYTYSPYLYQEDYKQAQREAQQLKKGLWADTTCAPTHAPTKRVNKKCSDFRTHKEAQDYFTSQGGQATNNVDGLDGADHDGIVCESLP